MKRRMAAILVADVVGYSTMMEVDESGAARRLKAARAEIDSEIAKTEGRLFKAMGDSVLVESASPIDAVQCAVGIRARLALEAEGKPVAHAVRAASRGRAHRGRRRPRRGGQSRRAHPAGCRSRRHRRQRSFVEQIVGIRHSPSTTAASSTFKNIVEPVRVVSRPGRDGPLRVPARTDQRRPGPAEASALAGGNANRVLARRGPEVSRGGSHRGALSSNSAGSGDCFSFRAPPRACSAARASTIHSSSGSGSACAMCSGGRSASSARWSDWASLSRRPKRVLSYGPTDLTRASRTSGRTAGRDRFARRLDGPRPDRRQRHRGGAPRKAGVR